jgi:hypothetical protein
MDLMERTMRLFASEVMPALRAGSRRSAAVSARRGGLTRR